MSLSPLLPGCTVTVDEGETGPSDATESSGSDDGESPVCGNGIIEAGEACDSEKIGPVSCATFGLGEGELSCGALCTIDASACSDFGMTSMGSNTSAATSADSDDVGEETGYGDDYSDSYGDEYSDSYADTGYSDTNDSDTGPLSPVCEAYGEVIAGCNGGNASQYAGYCQSTLDYYAGYGPACAAAFEDYYVCIGGLQCRELRTGCTTELDAVEAECF